MFGKFIPVGTIRNIPLRIDLSWFITFSLVVWSLVIGLFPTALPELSRAQHLSLAFVTALLFFASLMAHELGHALTAQRYGLRVRSITLFLLGGAAELTDEPENPRHEFIMTVNGPAVSLVLAGAFWLLAQLPVPGFIHVVADLLAQMNFIVGMFNLLPGYPLDGGRIVRAVAWRLSGNMLFATKLAAAIGKVMAMGLLVAGFIFGFAGNFVSGIWVATLGVFLYQMAGAGYVQAVVHEYLKSVPIHSVMQHRAVIATPDQFVGQMRHMADLIGEDVIPVIEGDALIGYVSRERLQGCTDPTVRMSEVMHPCSPISGLHAGFTAAQALEVMRHEEVPVVPVVQNHECVGFVSIETIHHYLTARANPAV